MFYPVIDTSPEWQAVQSVVEHVLQCPWSWFRLSPCLALLDLHNRLANFLQSLLSCAQTMLGSGAGFTSLEVLANLLLCKERRIWAFVEAQFRKLLLMQMLRAQRARSNHRPLPE